MAEIKVNVKWTEDEMLTAFDHHWRSGAQKIITLILTLVGVLFLGIGIYGAAVHGYGWLTALFMMVGVYFTLGRNAVRRAMVRLRTRRSPAYGKTIEMTFSDVGIRSTIPQTFNSTVKWDYYGRAVATPDGIMLYQNPVAFLWLPKDAFRTDADFLAMLDLLQKHIMEFKEVD